MGEGGARCLDLCQPVSMSSIVPGLVILVYCQTLFVSSGIPAGTSGRSIGSGSSICCRSSTSSAPVKSRDCGFINPCAAGLRVFMLNKLNFCRVLDSDLTTKLIKPFEAG